MTSKPHSSVTFEHYPDCIEGPPTCGCPYRRIDELEEQLEYARVWEHTAKANGDDYRRLKEQLEAHRLHLAVVLDEKLVTEVAFSELKEQYEVAQQRVSKLEGVLAMSNKTAKRRGEERDGLKEQMQTSEREWKAENEELALNLNAEHVKVHELQEQLEALRKLSTDVGDAWTISDAHLGPLLEACQSLDNWLVRHATTSNPASEPESA